MNKKNTQLQGLPARQEVKRAAVKLASDINRKAGFNKVEADDIEQALWLALLEQHADHNHARSKPITRSYNTVAFDYKFKGDAFDYRAKLNDDIDSDDDDLNVDLTGKGAQDINNGGDGQVTETEHVNQSLTCKNDVEVAISKLGVNLSRKRKNEILNNNLRHFKAGDLFGGV